MWLNPSTHTARTWEHFHNLRTAIDNVRYVSERTSSEEDKRRAAYRLVLNLSESTDAEIRQTISYYSDRNAGGSPANDDLLLAIDCLIFKPQTESEMQAYRAWFIGAGQLFSIKSAPPKTSGDPLSLFDALRKSHQRRDVTNIIASSDLDEL